MFLRLKTTVAYGHVLDVAYQCKVDSIIMVADRYMNGRNKLKATPHPPPPIHFTEHHLEWLQTGSASDRLMLLPHLMQQIHERPQSIHCKRAIVDLTQSLLPNPEGRMDPTTPSKTSRKLGTVSQCQSERT